MFFSLQRGAACGALFLLLTACSDGGGGSGDAPKLLAGGNNNTSAPLAAATTMTCKDTGNVQCSGESILRVANGIALTASGVQTYGISTNDLLTPNPDVTQAYGLRPASGGLAELRSRRDASGKLQSVALLLSNLGLSWDGKKERPLIIDTFSTVQGRAQLDSNGQITFGPLPPPTDVNFYDYGQKGALGTQAHYANNVYFPRPGSAGCGSGKSLCLNAESLPLQILQGDWKTGGSLPDSVIAVHLHADGATQAGDILPVDGQVSDGVIRGIPYPGFKGYRNLYQWSYGWANVAGWITQDTVLIDEWGGNNEHNKMRRGIVAYGAVTNPALIPKTGTATYTGALRGWFSYDELEDSYPIYGDVEVIVDFAKRSAKVVFTNVRLDEADFANVPIALTATTDIGSDNLANYFSGSAGNDNVTGGIGGRFFGPVTTSGGSSGPAEVAGSFTFHSPNKGPVAIGGFLLKKQ